jgi:hypothetical protein
MTKTTVRRIGVFSLGKIMGLLYALLGLFLGAIFALMALFGAAFGSAIGGQEGADAVFGLFFGVGAVIFVPIFYGLIGFIGGLLTAAIYNLIASATGGLELELTGVPIPSTPGYAMTPTAPAPPPVVSPPASIPPSEPAV